jgi:hypothetical protein
MLAEVSAMNSTRRFSALDDRTGRSLRDAKDATVWTLWFMSRHESVTDEYVAELRARFLALAERVYAASGWPETQRLMVTYTYPLLVAQTRLDQGWSRDQIAEELAVRITTASLTGNIHVIGDEKRNDIP